MYFEPYEEGKVRKSKSMCLQDILKKVYVKIGGRKIPVFLYTVKTHHSRYQLWYWDTVPQIHDFVVMFARQGPAYLWHRCCQWRWDVGSLMPLFQAAFDSSTAISAMNSRWNAKKNCAMEIIMSPEAAAMLNFGSSPYILKDGEDKKSRQKREEGVIERGNLHPDDIGGVEADDLASLGNESNTETVFNADEDDNIEDDDVSCLDDEDGFEEDDGDESTVAQEQESDEDVEMEEESGDDSDKDSAFSTKSGLDKLKKGGRKICEDSSVSDNEIIHRENMIRRLEQEKVDMQAAFDERMKQMEIEMHQKMQAMMASAMGSTAPAPGVEGVAATKGSTSPTKESDNSQQADVSNASATIK
jgi:hypothetical protein